MTGDGRRQMEEGQRRRVGDQVRFLAETQRAFYADTRAFLKEELGLRCLVGASNWHVTDARLLDALERYTYAATDIIDQHGYFDPPHDGEASSYAVRVGHTFTSRSALRDPSNLPIQTVQVAGKPQMISEIGWPQPNLYRSEGLFLSACYGALQGVDAICHFAINGPSWDQTMKKFALATPSVFGTSPALSLIYRRGYVAETAPVFQEVLDLEALYRLKGSRAVAGQSLEKFRRKDVPKDTRADAKTGVFDPLTCYVGQVTRSFTGNSAEAVEEDLSSFIDRNGTTVRSLNGQLEWDYGAGVLTVRADRAQGAVGFLGAAGTVDCGILKATLENEYGSILLVSLDGTPLAESRRMLLQVMTVDRPYGFHASGGRAEGTITRLGGGPFGVEKIRGRVRLSGKGIDSRNVIPLDENGYEREVDVETERGAGRLGIRLRDNTAYYIIEP